MPRAASLPQQRLRLHPFSPAAPSDGCLTAEVIKHHAGGRFAVDLHNYSEALSGPRKRDNWNLLHEKVLRKHLLTHRPRQFACTVAGCEKRFYERAQSARHARQARLQEDRVMRVP